MGPCLCVPCAFRLTSDLLAPAEVPCFSAGSPENSRAPGCTPSQPFWAQPEWGARGREKEQACAPWLARTQDKALGLSLPICKMGVPDVAAPRRALESAGSQELGEEELVGGQANSLASSAHSGSCSCRQSILMVFVS